MDMPPKDIVDALDRMHLLNGATPRGEPLAGGVSSDIWRIDLPGGPICIKRALPKLRVKADWQAPVERNVYEARWMQVRQSGGAERDAGAAGSGRGIGHAGDGLSAAGAISAVEGDACATAWSMSAFAASVAVDTRPHPCRDRREPVAGADFPTDAIFRDIRLEPYLTQTGRAHPDLAERMRRADRDDACGTSTRWCMAMSARRTFCAAPTARCFWMRNVRGGAIRRSIWRFA